MKKKSSKSFEFLTIFATLVGLCIGMGIYLKNDTQKGHVLGESQNAWMGIIAWLVVGILGITTILVFLEIASTSKKSNGTLTIWSAKFMGRRTGSLVSIFFLIFYTPIFYPYFCLLVISTSLTAIFNDNPSNHISVAGLNAIYICGALVIMSIFGFGNSLTRKPGKIIQIIGVWFKLLPLLTSLVVGFVIQQPGNALHTKTGEWTAMRFFATLAPVLFSFEGFVYAANLKKEAYHKKIVPIALLSGMAFVCVYYVLQATALMLGSSDGSVFTLFNEAFGKSVSGKTIQSILNWSIVITILISVNGYSLILPTFLSSVSDEGLLFYGKKKMNLKKSGLIQISLSYLGLIIFGTISIVVYKNPLQIFDIFSNATAVLTFLLYGALIIAAMVNRKTNKVEVQKIKFFWPLAIFSVILLIVIPIYSTFTIISNLDVVTWVFFGVVLAIAILFGINEYMIVKNSNKYVYFSAEDINEIEDEAEEDINIQDNLNIGSKNQNLVNINYGEE